MMLLHLYDSEGEISASFVRIKDVMEPIAVFQ